MTYVIKNWDPAADAETTREIVETHGGAMIIMRCDWSPPHRSSMGYYQAEAPAFLLAACGDCELLLGGGPRIEQKRRALERHAIEAHGTRHRCRSQRRTCPR